MPQVSAFKTTVFQCCYSGLVFVSQGRELWELLLLGAVAGGLSGKKALAAAEHTDTHRHRDNYSCLDCVFLRTPSEPPATTFTMSLHISDMPVVSPLLQSGSICSTFPPSSPSPDPWPASLALSCLAPASAVWACSRGMLGVAASLCTVLSSVGHLICGILLHPGQGAGPRDVTYKHVIVHKETRMHSRPADSIPNG